MVDPLAPFVARHHRQMLAAEQRTSTFDGTLLFGDVSGFTALNERLSGLGREGAELMVGLLDAVFGRALETAGDYGGDLLKFGGDALLIMFEGPDHTRRAAAAALAMQGDLPKRTVAHRAVGRTRLTMSMGLESGSITLLRCGELASEPVVLGSTLEEALRRESAAAGGEVLLGPNAASALATHTQARDDGVLLNGAPSVDKCPPAITVDDGLADQAMSRPLRDHLSDPERFGEHRPVTTAFVRYDTNASESPRRALGRIGHIVDVAQRACEVEGVTFVMADVGIGNGKLLLSGGAPRSLGDSTDRVLDVALRLVSELGDQVAVGVNAGLIFCGEVGSADQRSFAAIGDAVNLAARITARAEPGQVLCEADTFGAANGAVDGRAVEPFMAKGKARPVETFAVTRRLRSADDATGRADVVAEGRQRDVAALLGAAAEVAAGASRIVQVVAPAGMGKSTVIEAAMAAAADLRPVRITGGRYLRLSPFGVLTAPLRTLLGLGSEGDGPALAAELTDLIATRSPDQLPWAPLLGIPLGVTLPPTAETNALEPRFRAHRLHGSLLALVQATVREPFALIVDDAQWLDESTASFLHHVANERPDGLMLVSAKRPDNAGLVLARERIDHAIELGPLDNDDAQRIVRTRAESIDPRTADALVERAGGHPLFLVSLIEAALSDSGADLPATVEDALRAELDRISSRVRRLLGHAAALGLEAELELLARSSGESETTVRRLLTSGTSFVDLGPESYRFTHPLRRDAAYFALPNRERRQAHARAGAALEELFEDPPSQLMSLHTFESGQFESNWHWARLAAAAARRAFAPETEAVELERALASAARSPHIPLIDQADLLEDLGEACEVLGRFSDAEAAYRRACRLDRRPSPTARRQTKVARVCRNAGEIRRGVVWVGKAQRGSAQLSPAERAFPARERAALLFRRGDLRGSLTSLEEASDFAVAGGEHLQLAESLRMIGTIRDLTGSNGLTALRRSIRLYERHGDPRGVASALNNLAAAEYDRGMWDQAIGHYELCAQRAETVGDLILAAIALNNLGEIHSDRGHLDRAQPIFEEACHTWTSVDYRIGRGVALNNLGRLHRRLGNLDRAIECLDEALAIFAEIEATDFIAEAWLRRAEVALADQDPDRCVADLDMANRAGAGMELGAPFLSVAHRLAAIAALHQGDRESYRRELAAARTMTTGLRYEAALVLEVQLLDHEVIDLTDRPKAASGRLDATFDVLGVVDSGQRQMLPSINLNQ